jgi:hypothetical protein
LCFQAFGILKISKVPTKQLEKLKVEKQDLKHDLKACQPKGPKRSKKVILGHF